MRLRTLLVAAATVLVLSGCGAPAPDVPVGAVAGASTGALFEAVVTAAPVAVGVPKSIAIPRLGITDEVVPVGIATDGSMDVPGVDESGWFDLGPRPGQPGDSLIAGHVDWNGRRGALGAITQLKAGDLVTVTDAAGTVRTFAVYAVLEIPKTQYLARTVPLLFSERTTADLSLVTCSGVPKAHEYPNNTIAEARLVT